MAHFFRLFPFLLFIAFLAFIYIANNYLAEEKIREIIDKAPDGYLEAKEVGNLLDAASIPRVDEYTAFDLNEAIQIFSKINASIAMKVIGPIHKFDVKGVVLNISSKEEVKSEFNRMIKIKDANAECELASGC